MTASLSEFSSRCLNKKTNHAHINNHGLLLKFALLELQYKTSGSGSSYSCCLNSQQELYLHNQQVDEWASRKMRRDCGKYKQAEKMENNWSWLWEGFPIWGFLHHESLFFSAQQWKLESNLFFLNKFHTRVFDKQTRGNKGNLTFITRMGQPIYYRKHLVLEGLSGR